MNRTPLAAAIIDVVFVVIFVLIGRQSHSEDLLGSLNTVWPFLVGLIVGWLVARAWRASLQIRWTGVILVVLTDVVGMLLRIASGQGVVASFVIVTTIVLGIFLLGWRALAQLILRRRSRGGSSDA